MLTVDTSTAHEAASLRPLFKRNAMGDKGTVKWWQRLRDAKCLIYVSHVGLTHSSD